MGPSITKYCVRVTNYGFFLILMIQDILIRKTRLGFPRIMCCCRKSQTPNWGSLLRLQHDVVMTGNRRHYSDVIMSVMVSQITGVSIVYSTICSGTDQRNHQNSTSLAFVRGIHRSPVNSPHKVPVTWKMSPFDDVIVINSLHIFNTQSTARCVEY